MRIAFIAQPFERMTPPVRGGSLALWIYYMAQLCVERGHQATVFANHGGHFHSIRTESGKVDYVFTPTAFDRLLNKFATVLWEPAQGVFRSDTKSRSFSSSWHHRQYAMEVGKRARHADCDVVHIMNYSQFVPVVRKQHPRVKIVLHMQCEWLTQLDRAVIASRLEHTDLIIGCSEYITSLVARAFPEHANRCVTVPNAADHVSAQSTRAAGERSVLFLGRLSPEKGVHDLVESFHQVLRRFPDARLHLVGGAGSAPVEFMVGLSDDPLVTALRRFYPARSDGDGDFYLHSLEQLAGSEIGKRIFFDGRVDHDQIENHYRRATVLVNPSLSESFGITVVEAMMRSIPVVATRVGGMTYTVDDGVTGLLAEPANPGALAEAICRILADDGGACRMGEAGREKAVVQFSWSRTADQFLEYIQTKVF